jgi:hypothetical protein
MGLLMERWCWPQGWCRWAVGCSALFNLLLGEGWLHGCSFLSGNELRPPASETNGKAVRSEYRRRAPKQPRAQAPEDPGGHSGWTDGASRVLHPLRSGASERSVRNRSATRLTRSARSDEPGGTAIRPGDGSRGIAQALPRRSSRDGTRETNGKAVRSEYRSRAPKQPRAQAPEDPGGHSGWTVGASRVLHPFRSGATERSVRNRSATRLTRSARNDEPGGTAIRPGDRSRGIAKFQVA